MTAPLLLVTGTGTGIGKTHIGEALLLAWGRTARVVGYKPIESGVATGEGADARRLRVASSFHVKHRVPTFAFQAPLSPHLAARREGRSIDLAAVVDAVRALRASCDGVLVELPGGLFTPLTDAACNLDLALGLCPTAVVLVAPDRLGVLHDVGAATVAALARGLPIAALALSAAERPDLSSGTNAIEIRHLWPRTPVLALPRDHVAKLARLPELQEMLDICLQATARTSAPALR